MCVCVVSRTYLVDDPLLLLLHFECMILLLVENALSLVNVEHILFQFNFAAFVIIMMNKCLISMTMNIFTTYMFKVFDKRNP